MMTAVMWDLGSHLGVSLLKISAVYLEKKNIPKKYYMSHMARIVLILTNRWPLDGAIFSEGFAFRLLICTR